MEAYTEFLDRKAQLGNNAGFEPVWMPEFLYPFQRSLVQWSILKGRASLFEDCGLGKTPQQLVWAENVVRKTNRPVLVLTPLAVTSQTVKEAEKFGVEARRCRDGDTKKFVGVIVTNYEQLHKFTPADFAGVVLDESGILKNFEGSTRDAIVEFMRTIKYRLLCTATPSPNDYIELGNSSECLGELGYMDMLSRFFKNEQNSLHPNMRKKNDGAWYGVKWRFKAHAEKPFWRWLCSWARALRMPSDLGFDNGKFVLPPLEVRETIVAASRPMEGYLFTMPAVGLAEQRKERRHTLNERCEKIAEITLARREASIAWCHLNDEGDVLEKLIPGCVQVSGKDSDDTKEEKIAAFLCGQVKYMVIKPVIGAWGLNLQHCRHMTIMPSNSFEQYYQCVRRCWRFPQTEKVEVDIVATEGESDVMRNLQRKSVAAERMFEQIVAHMKDELKITRSNPFTKESRLPAWLS